MLFKSMHQMVWIILWWFTPFTHNSDIMTASNNSTLLWVTVHKMRFYQDTVSLLLLISTAWCTELACGCGSPVKWANTFAPHSRYEATYIKIYWWNGVYTYTCVYMHWPQQHFHQEACTALFLFPYFPLLWDLWTSNTFSVKKTKGKKKKKMIKIYSTFA